MQWGVPLSPIADNHYLFYSAASYSSQASTRSASPRDAPKSPAGTGRRPAGDFKRAAKKGGLDSAACYAGRNVGTFSDDQQRELVGETPHRVIKPQVHILLLTLRPGAGSDTDSGSSVRMSDTPPGQSARQVMRRLRPPHHVTMRVPTRSVGRSGESVMRTHRS